MRLNSNLVYSPLSTHMSLVNLLRVCTNTKSLLNGKSIHARLIKSGSHRDAYTNNHLLTTYLKLNQFIYAQQMFDDMPERNIITWTTLISSYSQVGFSEKALDCFRSMVLDDFVPNNYTYVGAISACTKIGAIRSGKEIHGRIYRSGESLNRFVSNCLVNFYGKCGLLKSAKSAFDAILEPNLVTWASIISCYCQCGENEEGLRVFLRSLRVGLKVNEFICANILGACAALEGLEVGTQVHCLSVKSGVRMDQFVETALVNIYAKCGELEMARRAFWEVDEPHLTAWTALIGGCLQVGKAREAIDLFCKLLSSGSKPSEKTYATVLGAFVDGVGTHVGKQLHSSIIKLGYNTYTFVCNALLDFYSKSGLLEESFKAFQEMDEHDVVTWNAIIAGFVNYGHYEEAIGFFRSMLSEGFDPSLYTYSSLLSICGDFPAIEWGKQTHSRITKPGFEFNVVVGSALIDMYAKCGRLDYARKVFDCLPSKNLVSWNTMLIGYGQHGFGKEALEIYDMMQREGVKPNDITFLGVLSACGHVGLLEDGLHHFDSMTREFGISPRTDHLACMVSLFARRGQTKRAYDFIKNFPGKPDKVVWRCLLSGCKVNKDLDLGKYAAEKILSIDPDDTSAHIMLSNIYADLKMWNETAQVRKMINKKALKKDTGYSWTELHNKIYSFSAGENLFPQGYSELEILSGLTAQLADAGYVPDALSSWNYTE